MSSDTDSTQSTTTTTTPPATPTQFKSITQIQTFPLAHPPPPKHTLRLTSHLSLQIQQLTPTSRRPTPILEVYQPSCFGKTLAGGPRKLTARDMYIVQSEEYTHLPGQSAGTIVGAIYMPVREETKKKGLSGGVWFPFGGGWEVSKVERGYRFSVRKLRTDGEGEVVRVVEWEKRSSRSRPSSAESGSEMKGDRFVLSIADTTQSGLRRPWLATLTRKGFKVGGWNRAQREYLSSALRGHGDVDEDAALYTCLLTMGVCVAAQEGWVNQYV
ncbi:hypothetical protein ETB97_006302 [Aspergillus alliaceus]|uniref:Uncharacterized protein n=2 Tax=Petromyces alliaceus TaxID=209559 RepID=A0A8H6E3F1_PETAA|nr:hypothetical protein ETB97_006302 [Aspergillus burnettii]